MNSQKKFLIIAVAIMVVVVNIAGAIYYLNKIRKMFMRIDNRYKDYYNLVYNWLTIKNDNKSAAQYFEKNNINTIAVYGMGTLGELLYNELNNSEIRIAYFIDQDAEYCFAKFDDAPVVGPDKLKDQEKVDAVVITPVYEFEVIANSLKNMGCNCDLISLRDVISGV